MGAAHCVLAVENRLGMALKSEFIIRLGSNCSFHFRSLWRAKPYVIMPKPQFQVAVVRWRFHRVFVRNCVSTSTFLSRPFRSPLRWVINGLIGACLHAPALCGVRNEFWLAVCAIWRPLCNFYGCARCVYVFKAVLAAPKTVLRRKANQAGLPKVSGPRPNRKKGPQGAALH